MPDSSCFSTAAARILARRSCQVPYVTCPTLLLATKDDATKPFEATMALLEALLLFSLALLGLEERERLDVADIFLSKHGHEALEVEGGRDEPGA